MYIKFNTSKNGNGYYSLVLDNVFEKGKKHYIVLSDRDRNKLMNAGVKIYYGNNEQVVREDFNREN